MSSTACRRRPAPAREPAPPRRAPAPAPAPGLAPPRRAPGLGGLRLGHAPPAPAQAPAPALRRAGAGSSCSPIAATGVLVGGGDTGLGAGARVGFCVGASTGFFVGSLGLSVSGAGAGAGAGSAAGAASVRVRVLLLLLFFFSPRRPACPTRCPRRRRSPRPAWLPRRRRRRIRSLSGASPRGCRRGSSCCRRAPGACRFRTSVSWLLSVFGGGERRRQRQRGPEPHHGLVASPVPPPQFILWQPKIKLAGSLAARPPVLLRRTAKNMTEIFLRLTSLADFEAAQQCCPQETTTRGSAEAARSRLDASTRRRAAEKTTELTGRRRSTTRLLHAPNRFTRSRRKKAQQT